MSDEQIIETLENFQAYCAYHRVCKKCKFEIDREEGGKECQLQKLFVELAKNPMLWDMYKIRKLFRK
ncbi:MAG: hypothetical protein Q4A12_08310 [Eubacteriales bacterium]|nr:hypothetical protein [Eubacteriales bacterium]